ncbi:hypothetical protein [Streptomyces collinus]|uniref:hypothetical protein n=1 Tax=Streptomyces collinus TaxID=42684 RepID=UPI0033217035
MGDYVLGQPADGVLGGEVQGLVQVLGGEDLVVGVAVAAHGTGLVQDEEEAAGFGHASCVLVG